MLVDIDTRETITLGDTDLTVAENNITIDATRQLQENHHYSITATVSNIADSAISRTRLSKQYLAD